jgi:transporter family protein
MQTWIIYALLAAISAALVGIFSKVGIKGVDATVATSIRGMVIALSMGIFALMYGKWHTLAETDSRALLFIVLAGLFGGLSWLWGFLALQGGGDVTAVNAIDRLSLVFILIFAVLFLGDALTWMRGIGVTLIFIGVLFTTLTQEQLTSLIVQLKNLVS